MKILSFDVGIKNLAFCLIEKEDDTNEFKINEWGIINLMRDQQTCQYLLRTKKLCEKPACNEIYHSDKIMISDKIYCCNAHKDKMIPSIIKQKCDFNCLYCDNKSEYCLTTYKTGFCKMHYDKKHESFEKKIKIKKKHVVKCGKMPFQDISILLFNIIDNEHPNFINCDYVLIENQPSLRNPISKSISCLLYSYFVIRGIIDVKNIKEIKFISPSNKLKVDIKNTNKVITKDIKDKTIIYKLTKKLGIKYCKSLINDSDLEILNQYKKKDDMCDAFLQGFQYLFNPVPQIYIDKLSIVGFDET